MESYHWRERFPGTKHYLHTNRATRVNRGGGVRRFLCKKEDLFVFLELTQALAADQEIQRGNGTINVADVVGDGRAAGRERKRGVDGESLSVRTDAQLKRRITGAEHVRLGLRERRRGAVVASP